MNLKTIEDIPKSWKVLEVRKKTSVRIRPCEKEERFKVSWSDSELVAKPDEDLIIISSEGTEYPHKIDLFHDVYEQCGCTDQWRKKLTSKIVEIPEAVEPFEITTLEGVVDNVAYPDYVAIGSAGELYVNTREFVESNLEILN